MTTKKINVLFVQSQTYLGADSKVHGLVMEHLDRSRFEVHVACSPGTRAERSDPYDAFREIPDLHVRRTNFGPSWNSMSHVDSAVREVRAVPSGLTGLAGLVRYARKHEIDIVHGTEKPRDAVFGLLVARAAKAKAITHVHVKAAAWLSRPVQWAMRHDDALLGVSEFVAESIAALGHAPEKIYWALNSLDTSRWAPSTDGSPIRHEFGIPDGVPLLSIVARVFPYKGHGLLLRALAPLKAEGIDFRLLIVGDDDPRATEGGGSYTAELRELTRELALEDRVLFAGYRTDIAPIMAATDIYAMPTFEEPQGVVFFEAMAMRKPIVSLRSGGVPEVVEHGVSGLLSEPDDVAGLTANLRRLLLDPAERAAMGARGSAVLHERFTPRHLADDIGAIYERILGRDSPARSLAEARADAPQVAALG